MTSDPVPGADDGYDEWADALVEEGFYLECPNEHGSLPPRRVCPECGSDSLSEVPLPVRGEIVTFSQVHVAPPDFADNTPYVTAIAEFGPVRLTGIVRGLDAEEVTVGTRVETDVAQNGTTGKRLVVFRPRQ
ncbi:Zn-ribbon domain-containing OB-fold protein [Halobaculum sp. MBLA0147]|uniref:Zn-ribbon domain-containing OB-fold protein n=1 Tax=Halobaculum sp. MBLA0147 TaxID=3079934 RepID=UPI003525B849